MVENDEDLLERWKSGDLGAAGTLVARYRDDVARFVTYMDGTAHDDLIQDTLVACMESGVRFRGKSSFRTYMLGVARNLVHAERRRRQRQRRLETMGMPWETVDAERVEPPDGLAEHSLMCAVSELPTGLRDTIERFYFEGQSRPEIAAALDLPEGTVASRMRLARERLKRRLTSSFEAIRHPPSRHTALRLQA